MKLKELMDSMSKHAQADYPREAVGIITNDFKYVPCKNIHPYPKNSFIVDPVALLKYENNCWGIFHSHPGDENPLPSEEDLRHTVFDEFKFIVGFGNKFFIYWFDRHLDVMKYEILEEKHLVYEESNNSFS